MLKREGRSCSLSICSFKAATAVIISLALCLCGVNILRSSQFFSVQSKDKLYSQLSNSSDKMNVSQQIQNDALVPEVHLVVVADANFAEQYRPIFEKNQQYANLHNYKWHVIGTESKDCSEKHKDFFFRKHCMISEWMESTLNKDDVVVVFDSDVVPYRSKFSLKNWTSTGEDIVLYERIWNTEIAAGNYIARNNPRTRQFLREWSEFEYEMPPNAFSSSDNGKLRYNYCFCCFSYGTKSVEES